MYFGYYKSSLLNALSVFVLQVMRRLQLEQGKVMAASQAVMRRRPILLGFGAVKQRMGKDGNGRLSSMKICLKMKRV